MNGASSRRRMTEARSEWWDEFWLERGSPSDEFESWASTVWDVALDFWEERFRRLAPGNEMLECGSGSAKVSAHFRRQGYKCTMLDYSEAGLNAGRARFAAAGLAGRFVVGDVNALGFQASRFDIVYSGGMLEFFSDIRKPIVEMVRVLRPGGVFAATMVPRKWSIQTLADLEIAVIRSGKRLLTGRIGEAWQMVRSVPNHYGVNSAKLREYVRACEDAGLVSVHGLGISPFPSLALPASGQIAYVRALKRWRPAWNRFDRSQSRWTEWVGSGYRVYGVKAR